LLLPAPSALARLLRAHGVASLAVMQRQRNNPPARSTTARLTTLVRLQDLLIQAYDRAFEILGADPARAAVEGFMDELLHCVLQLRIGARNEGLAVDAMTDRSGCVHPIEDPHAPWRTALDAYAVLWCLEDSLLHALEVLEGELQKGELSDVLEECLAQTRGRWRWLASQVADERRAGLIC